MCDDKDVELIKDMHAKIMPDCVLSFIDGIDVMNLKQFNGQIMIANVNIYQSQICYFKENNIPGYFCDLVPLSSINASIKKNSTWRDLSCEF